MAAPMTLPELHDAIAKAIADAQGHGMREKCERHADAVLAIVGPQLLANASSSPNGGRGGVEGVVPSIERIGWDKECDDVDRIIEKLGMTIEQARTEGGCLHLPRILNHIQETLDALAVADGFGRHMSDKYVAAVHAATHLPAQAAQVEDWRVGMFERWREAAQEKGYAGIAEAITAAPTSEPVAQGEAGKVWPSKYHNKRLEAIISAANGYDYETRSIASAWLAERLAAQPRAVPDELKELADEVEACWICASNGDGEITLETINNWSGRLAMIAAAPSQGEPA